MKRQILILIGFVFTINLLAQNEQITNNGMATVYVYRATMKSGKLDAKELFIEDKYVGEIKNKEYNKLMLPPGEYLLWVRTAHPSYINMKVEANKVYAIHAAIQIYKLKPHIRLYDLGKCNQCDDSRDFYKEGIERLHKLISQDKLFASTEKRNARIEKNKRKRIFKALKNYKEQNTKWPVETLETPIDFKPQ